MRLPVPTFAPPPLKLPAPGRVVAIGDVHGDASAFLNTLRNAGLVDGRECELANVKWIGGNATLVQTGDILDRGPDEPECMTLLRSLREQAERDGGKVVTLIGNHEVRAPLNK